MEICRNTSFELTVTWQLKQCQLAQVLHTSLCCVCCMVISDEQDFVSDVQLVQLLVQVPQEVDPAVSVSCVIQHEL